MRAAERNDADTDNAARAGAPAAAAAAGAPTDAAAAGTLETEAAEGDVAGAGEEDFETGMRQNAAERNAADADNAARAGAPAAAAAAGAPTDAAAAGTPETEAAEGDVAGAGEEDFETGMRQNAAERDAADADNDGMLDFEEFKVFVRAREEGEFTNEELKIRFDKLDEDGSGKVDMSEYLQFSLRDSLSRSSQRVCDLFRAWDEDKSGTIDKREFTRAIRALGFVVSDEDAGKVFDALDEDKSGSLEYKELNTMLRKGEGAEAVKARLKRGTMVDRSRGAKLTAKVTNRNYLGARVAVLPPMVKLDADSDENIVEQIKRILEENHVKLIDLFREWDADGNGAIDEKEFRQAVAALGYDAPRSYVDEVFQVINTSGSGMIEYNELKEALSTHSKKKGKLVLPPKAAAPAGAPAAAAAVGVPTDAAAAGAPATEAAECDVAGAGEEDFETGMRQAVIDRDVADADNDGMLDFEEFKVFIRDREEGEFTDEELKIRFDKLDQDGSGKVDMAEYIMFALRESLARSADRVCDLFRKWDEDKSGSIDKKEFARALRALGFDVDNAVAYAVFDTLDDDGSGKLEYKELNMMLRKGAGAEAVKRRLKRGSMADHGRGSFLSAKNINKNYQGARVSALPPMVKLDASSELKLVEQLSRIMQEHSIKLIDLFRDWDTDGNGAIDKKEFRQAVAALGYDAPNKAIDAVFATLDVDGGGMIEYHELKASLSTHSKKQGQVRRRKNDELKVRPASALSTSSVDSTDKVGTGEEEFVTGMRQNAMDREAADLDGDNMLDFDEFCQFVRDREEGEFTMKELKKRFEALDTDGSGKINLAEYVAWSLRDALSRSSDRVCDLFRKWDEDKSGSIDKKEFVRAIKCLGFDDITVKEAGTVFDELDEDGSGFLEYKELNRVLRKGGAGAEAAKRNLKRVADRRSSTALTARNMNKNFEAAKVAALPPMVKLDPHKGPIKDQLVNILAEHSVKLVDLFREWDIDGDGVVDKKEFRQAVAGLGYDVPKKDMDDLFDDLDEDRGGAIEFYEFKKALHTLLQKAIVKKREEKRERLAKAGRLGPPPKPLLPPEELMDGEGGELVVLASGTHTHTVVLLHSMYGSAEMYSRLYRRFLNYAAGFKFIFPRAPERPLISPNGDEYKARAWYNPTTLRDTGDVDGNTVDMDQLAAQTARIHHIIEREASILGGDCGRVVLGGTHMGGSVALHAAMNFRAPLGALVCMRTNFLPLGLTKAVFEVNETPVFVFAADEDRVHPLHLVRESFDSLKRAGFKLEWHVEPELDHANDCLNEQRYAAYWIVKTCIGQKAGNLVKGTIHDVKPPKPPAPPPEPKQPPPHRRRALSARPASQTTKSNKKEDPFYNFLHALMREPDWRGGSAIRGPGWDTRKATGFISPFSPLHSRPTAMVTRVDRGGPLLGRVIRSPRDQAEPVGPAASAPPTRPATARREWNDSTRATIFDPPPLYPAGDRPVTVAGHPGQGTPLHPVIEKGAGPFNYIEQRPSTSPGIQRGGHGQYSTTEGDEALFPMQPLVARPATANNPSPRSRGAH
jgi:Ca2+-binding EF-hand superfamily protein/predicted esterase